MTARSLPCSAASLGGLLLLLASGCSVPVAGNLEDRDANLVADALNQAGLDAVKESDPSSEGHYRISVNRDDAAQAIAELREHDLPPRHAPGLADALGRGSIVPSPTTEHAQYVAGVSGDLERTLSSVDGVLGAHVHLSVPVPNPLSDKPVERATASVLIKHIGATPPVCDADIRRIVAGAVANLRTDDVSVVMVSRPPSAATPERPLSHFGPIAVTRSSATWLRVGFSVVLALLIGLSTIVVYLWIRLRKQPAQALARETM